MRVFIYILRLAIGPIIGLLAYFGYIPNWPGLMDWLTSADLWLINSAEYPALFILGIALFLGLFVVPESLRLVARHLLLGKKSEEYAALKKERPKDSAAMRTQVTSPSGDLATFLAPFLRASGPPRRGE